MYIYLVMCIYHVSVYYSIQIVIDHYLFMRVLVHVLVLLY